MAGFPRWGYFSWCARHVFLRLWPKICRLLCSQRIRSCNWTRSWSIVRLVKNLYTVYFAVLDVLILKIRHRPVRQMWFVFLTCRFVWFVPVLSISDHLTFGNVHDAPTVRNFNVKRYAVVVLFQNVIIIYPRSSYVSSYLFLNIFLSQRQAATVVKK